MYVDLSRLFTFSKILISWSILYQIIVMVQLSMNMNAGIYGSALEQFQDYFNVTAQVGRLGQGLFLISYAFGCELWAPFSEE